MGVGKIEGVSIETKKRFLVVDDESETPIREVCLAKTANQVEPTAEFGISNYEPKKSNFFSKIKTNTVRKNKEKINK